MITLLALLAAAPAASAQTPPPPEAPVEEPPPLVKAPALINFVQAPYPQQAKDDGIEGTVLLLIEIDAAGAVTRVEVLEEAGFGFDEAALEAAKQFTFSPAEDATGPVPVGIEFEYGFVLDTTTHEGAVPETPAEEAVIPVNLEGTVLEMATRRPLPDMSVAIEGTDFVTTTGPDGHFEFRGVPAGSALVMVARPGWEARRLDVVIAEGEVTAAQIWVKNENYADDAAVGVYRKNKDEITRRTITMTEVRQIPGTFGDPIRVIQNLPGAARSPFSTGLLIIRGANPEDSGVYVDGIRIPFIYHLGGFASVISPDLVESVDYLPGAYGVQYGRTMGGAVDVTTKKEAPEQARITWSTDALDSGGLYEGRLGEDGNHHVGFAARRSYADLVIRPFTRDNQFQVAPRWADYQVRYSYQGWEKTELSVFVMGFDDKLLLSTPDDYAQGTDPDGQGDVSVHYFTHRAIVSVEHELSDTFALRVSPSFGWDFTEFGVGQALQLNQDQWIVELRAEAPWSPSPKVEIVPGVDFIGGWWRFQAELPFDPSSFAGDSALEEREDWGIKDSGTAWGPDFYLKANLRPFEDPDRMILQPGIRVSYVTFGEGQLQAWGLDPRVSGKVRLIDSQPGYLKASTGIYTQPPQPTESYAPGGNVDVGFERAFSSTVGWDQQLGQAVHLEVEGFYKDLDRLIVVNPEYDSIDDAPYKNLGEGRIYGGEFMLRHDPVDKLFGWISYTLSRSERRDAPDEDWYLFDFDQTHILTALAGYNLPFAFKVSGRVQYVTGNPYTPYAGAVYDIDSDSWTPYSTAPYNSERLPPYLAVDGRVERGFTFKSWRMDLYLDLLNVYRGENPEFIFYNYDYTESVYVRGLPFIPSPGVNFEFYL